MSAQTIINTVSALAIAVALTLGTAACTSAPADEPTKTTPAPAASPEAATPSLTEAPAAPATPEEELQSNSGLTTEQYEQVAADYANYGIEGIPEYISKVEAETGKLVTIVVLRACPADPSIMTYGTAGELQHRPAMLCSDPTHPGHSLVATLDRLKEIQERKRLSDDEVAIIVID